MRSKSLGTLLFSILIFVVVARNVRHVKNDWRNVPEYPGENSTQIQKVFLTQLENPNGKNVKIENNVLEFLRDAMVNISVKNNQLTLSVKEDNIVLGEKILYFCFKSTTQNYISTECPHGFCEIRMEFSTTSQSEAVHISFDNQTQVLLGKLVTAVISRNSMKVTNIPNDLQPITTCNPDYSQEYLTVKVINKGDKIVKLSDVNLHNETSENAALGTGSIIGIVAGCAVFVGLSVGGFLIWWFCFKKKSQKENVEAQIQVGKPEETKKVDEKKQEVVVQTVPPKENLSEKVKILKNGIVAENPVKGSEAEKKQEVVVQNVAPKQDLSEKVKTLKNNNVAGLNPVKDSKAEKKEESEDDITELPTFGYGTPGEEAESDGIIHDPNSSLILKQFVEARDDARSYEGHYPLDPERNVYRRATVNDKKILAELIPKMKKLKQTDPNKWVMNVEELTMEAIVYLAGLGIISPYAEPILLGWHRFFSINEPNFGSMFESYASFVLRICRTQKYVRFWKKLGVEKEKEITREILEKTQYKVVMCRLTGFVVQMEHVLDHFQLDFTNPVIFLAPLQFLMILALKLQPTDEALMKVYHVIKYRASVMFKTFDVEKTFDYTFPIAELAYIYYVKNRCTFNESLEEGKQIIKDAKKQIANNPKWKNVWEETVSAAKKANRKFDRKIQKIDYSQLNKHQKKVFRKDYAPSMTSTTARR